MIKPQVSMPVLYFPHANDHYGVVGQPLAATISHVWSDTCVNLAIADSSGLSQNKTSVSLHQGSGNQQELHGVNGRFCEFPEWFRELQSANHIHAPLNLAEIGKQLWSHTRNLNCGDSRCVICALSPGELAGCQPTSQVLG